MKWMNQITVCGLLISSCVRSQELIEFSSGLADQKVNHSSPSYIASHIGLIESRPFDGLIVNDFAGRNLFNTRLTDIAPTVAAGPGGTLTYSAVATELAPLKGAFKRFKSNFTKVNFSMAGPPPALIDEAGWNTVLASAANYSKAVHDSGLKGIFFDNEDYFRAPLVSGNSRRIYWMYADQLALSGRSAPDLPFSSAVNLARQRGRQLMQAFISGYPGVTVIVAHGPQEGCSAWKAKTGAFGDDRYLLGAFTAGMVEGSSGRAMLVDGGEDYDLRTVREFKVSRSWRKGADAQEGGITNFGSRSHCPFMDKTLASTWSNRVQIAFSTFDKERASRSSNEWRPISDLDSFTTTLTNAFRSSEQYVWHYTQWQDWWGSSTDDQLQPWIEAINSARRDAGMKAISSR